MRTWTAATVCVASVCFALACSTTTNVTNVTTAADGGDAEGDAATSDGAVGIVENDAAADGGADVEAGACTGTPASGATSSSCRIEGACTSCGEGGYVYECAGGARPSLPSCVESGGVICCKAEWMRAPEDDSFCGLRLDYPKTFIGPNAPSGQVLPTPNGCVKQGSPDGQGTAMVCCP